MSGYTREQLEAMPAEQLAALAEQARVVNAPRQKAEDAAWARAERVYEQRKAYRQRLDRQDRADLQLWVRSTRPGSTVDPWSESFGGLLNGKDA